MSDFVSGKIDILISTTVIEVGVDVPNATVMFIDGAERFGLAQLHQLRGRVGRGDKQSYCYLHSTSLSHKTHERLSAVAQSTNGFELAERDLAMRGPGEMYGVEQSGVPEFRIAKLTDVVLIKTARSWAEKLFAEEGDLDGFPLLRDKVESFISNVHFE